MIQVQIASQLTATGVDGVRWVLVDPGSDEAASAAAQSAVPPVPASAAAAIEARSSAWSLPLLKLLVIGLAIVLAVGLARWLHGPVRLPGWAPAPPLPAGGRAPGKAMPAPAEPAPAASAPVLTAELR